MPVFAVRLLPGAIVAALLTAVAPTSAQVAPLPPGLADSLNAPLPPPPVNPDPRDFTGSWKPPGPGATSGTSAEVAFLAADMEAHRHCLPDFAPFSSIEGNAVFVTSHNMLLIVLEAGHRIRRIRLNGSHPPNLRPSYWGDSIAHWEGNTLVVETTDARGQIEAGGPMISPRMTMTERFRKTDGGAVLEDHISFADPAGEKLPAPFTLRFTWSHPQKILEWICEDAGQVYFDPNKK